MNIFHKIQLLTLIAIISSISILVYVDQAFASCTPDITGPCFDSFTKSHEKWSLSKIKTHIENELDKNFDNWSKGDVKFKIPGTIVNTDYPLYICTHYKADGNYYRSVILWQDDYTISSMEQGITNHCDLYVYPEPKGIFAKVIEIPEYLPPYKQMESIDHPTNVKCPPNMILKFKTQSLKPVCLTMETSGKLMDRGVVLAYTPDFDLPRDKIIEKRYPGGPPV